jgi:RNA polymerase sigma-70 factor (ECF subfamily)
MSRAHHVQIPSPEADELVAAAIAGDAEAFAALFRATVGIVHRFLQARCGDAALAEDLTQDTFIRAMRAIGTSFRGGSSDFVAWVVRIARNRFLDHVKSGRVRWEVAVENVPVTIATVNPEHDVLATIEGIDLRRALTRLTEEQQEVVLLRFLQGLQISEVATITGRSEGAVKALQFRALRSLQKILADEGLVGGDEEN